MSLKYKEQNIRNEIYRVHLKQKQQLVIPGLEFEFF